jgi:5-dehydro-4-deoxyglucarate dehydratase
VSLVKAGARLTGPDLGGVRPPLVDPTPEHVERLEGIIAAGRAALSLKAAS